MQSFSEEGYRDHLTPQIRNVAYFAKRFRRRDSQIYLDKPTDTHDFRISGILY